MGGADVLSSNPSRDRIFLLPGLNASRVARVEITNIETESRINVRKCLKELEAKFSYSKVKLFIIHINIYSFS